MWDCSRLSDELRLPAVSLSSPTIQTTLIKHQIGNRYESLLPFVAGCQKARILGAAPRLRLAVAAK